VDDISITVFIEGPETARFVSSDGRLDLSVKYECSPLARELWYQAELIKELLKRGSLRLRLSEETAVTVGRSNGSWLVRSEGNVEYEMEMTLEEAILLLLALLDTVEDLEKVDVEVPMGIFLLRIVTGIVSREELASHIRRRLDRAIVREKGGLWVIERRGLRFFLTLKKPGREKVSRVIWALTKMVGLEPTFEISSVQALNIIMNDGDVSRFLKDGPIMAELRKLLVRKVFGPKLRKARFEADRLVIESHGHEWAIDLWDGDLEVDERSTCIDFPSLARRYGTLITPYGPVELDEYTAKVLAATSMALEPWRVCDSRLARRLLEAFMLKHGLDLNLYRLPLAPGVLRAWLKLERLLNLLPRPLKDRIRRLAELLT